MSDTPLGKTKEALLQGEFPDRDGATDADWEPITAQTTHRKQPVGKLVRKDGQVGFYDDESETDDDFLDELLDDEAFDPTVELPLWPRTKNKRYWVYLLLSEPLSSKVAQGVSVFILLAIMASVIMFVLETLPEFQRDRGSKEPRSFEVFVVTDYIFMSIFTLEYLLRLIGASGTPQHILKKDLPPETMPEDEQEDEPSDGGAGPEERQPSGVLSTSAKRSQGGLSPLGEEKEKSPRDGDTKRGDDPRERLDNLKPVIELTVGQQATHAPLSKESPLSNDATTPSPGVNASSGTDRPSLKNAGSGRSAPKVELQSSVIEDAISDSFQPSRRPTQTEEEEKTGRATRNENKTDASVGDNSFSSHDSFQGGGDQDAEVADEINGGALLVQSNTNTTGTHTLHSVTTGTPATSTGRSLPPIVNEDLKSGESSRPLKGRMESEDEEDEDGPPTPGARGGYDHIRVKSYSTRNSQHSTSPFPPRMSSGHTQLSVIDLTAGDEDAAARRRCLHCRAWCLTYCICCTCCLLGCGTACCRRCITGCWDVVKNRRCCDKQWRREFVATSKRRQPEFWEYVYKPIWKMWVFFKTPLNLIDFLAVAPFVLDLFFQLFHMGVHTAFNPSVVLRTFRLARVFRVMKLSKHTKAVNLFFRVLRRSSGPLGLLAFFLALCVIVFGSIVFSVEHGEWHEGRQCYVRRDSFSHAPEDICTPFSDMLMAFYWVFVTITTVGYGDMYPMTPVGRMVAILCMLVGVVGFAMPITVISTTFQDEYETLKSSRRKEYLGTRIKEWDVDKVATWVSDIGNGRLQDFADKFRREKITGDLLELIQDEHLVMLGMTQMADRLAFKRAVQSLQKDSDFEPDPLARIEQELSEVQISLTKVSKAVRACRASVEQITSMDRPDVRTPSFVPKLPPNLQDWDLDANPTRHSQYELFQSSHDVLLSSPRLTGGRGRGGTRGRRATHHRTMSIVDMQKEKLSQRLDWVKAMKENPGMGKDVPTIWELAEWDHHSV